MTNTPDTSPEAVERLAKDHDEVGNSPDKYVMGHPHHWKTAVTLRALSAKLEAEKRHKLAITGDKINAVSELRQVKAERDAIKAELADAVGLLRYVVSKDDEAVDKLQAAIGLTLAAAKARVYLARHQKEKNT